MPLTLPCALSRAWPRLRLPLRILILALKRVLLCVRRIGFALVRALVLALVRLHVRVHIIMNCGST